MFIETYSQRQQDLVAAASESAILGGAGNHTAGPVEPKTSSGSGLASSSTVTAAISTTQHQDSVSYSPIEIKKLFPVACCPFYSLQIPSVESTENCCVRIHVDAKM